MIHLHFINALPISRKTFSPKSLWVSLACSLLIMSGCGSESTAPTDPASASIEPLNLLPQPEVINKKAENQVVAMQSPTKVRALGWSPSGQLLVGHDMGLTLWKIDPKNGSAVLQTNNFQKSPGSVVAIAAFPDNRWIIAGQGVDPPGASLGVWSEQGNEPEKFLTSKVQSVAVPAFFNKNAQQTLVSTIYQQLPDETPAEPKKKGERKASRTQAVVYDYKSGKTEFEQPVSMPTPRLTLFSPDGTRLLTICSNSGATQAMPVSELTVWDLATKTPVKQVKASLGEVLDAAFQNDGKSLFVVRRPPNQATTNLEILDAGTLEIKSKIETTGIEPACLALSPDRKYLAVGGANGAIQILTIADLKPLEKSFKSHGSTVNALSFSPDGQFLATGGEDKTVAVWKIQ